MNTRERFQAVMNFQPVDRLPIIEWAAWWRLTIERWEAEGLPVGMDYQATCRYFGLDVLRQKWFRSMSSDALKNCGSIKSAADYERLKSECLVFEDPATLINPAELERWAGEQERGESVIWFTLEGFFWFPRKLFGIENHFLAFYDHPELMKRINLDNAEWMLKVIDKLCKYCNPVFMTFAEDMSYNHGAMISKEQFDEFLQPYYAMVAPEVKKRGIKALIDSDGNIHEAAAWFEAAGLDGILPLERQAGVDMSRLRREHPGQIYLGAFDKMVMDKGENAIRAEFERLLPVAQQGGLLISCDHQTPPAVSLQDYKLYVKLFREYAAKAAEATT